MALPKKKLQNIKNAAIAKSQNEPTAAQQAEYQKDFIESTVKLNEAIEDRLETFRSQAIPILREAYQSRPSGILSVISEETDKITELTQAIMGSMKAIRYPEFRNCAASCIKDLVEICTQSIAEQYKKASDRNGDKVQ
jgi:hypothetical protein